MIDSFYFLKSDIELTLTFHYNDNKKNILTDEQKMLNELNNMYMNIDINNNLILNVKKLITKFNEIPPIVNLQYFYQKTVYNFVCLVEVIKLNVNGIIFNVEPTFNEFNKTYEVMFEKYRILVIVENYKPEYGKVNVIIHNISALFRNIKIYGTIFNYSHTIESIPCIYQFCKIPKEYDFYDEMEKHVKTCDFKKSLVSGHPLDEVVDFLKNKTALMLLKNTLKGFITKDMIINTSWTEFESEKIYYLDLKYDIKKINHVLKLLENFQFVLIIHIPGMIETFSNCFLIPYAFLPPDIEKRTLNDYMFNTFNKYVFEMNNMNVKVYDHVIESLKKKY